MKNIYRKSTHSPVAISDPSAYYCSLNMFGRATQSRMDVMKPRNILYTASFLFILALLGGCSSTAEEEIAPILLFPDRHGWDLKQVNISDAEATLDFKRVDCVWVIGDENKPSDEQRVTALTESLATMAPQGLVEIDPQRYNDFKVGNENFTRKVVLTFKDKSTYTLLIGTPAITKPAYIRLADKYQVYRIDEPMLWTLDLDAESWLAPKEG